MHFLRRLGFGRTHEVTAPLLLHLGFLGLPSGETPASTEGTNTVNNNSDVNIFIMIEWLKLLGGCVLSDIFHGYPLKRDGGFSTYPFTGVHPSPV